MKKNLLLLAAILPLSTAFAQLGGYVGSGAHVKVKANTLLYVGGDFKVADETGTVSNDGFINVRGEYDNMVKLGDGSYDLTAENFVNTYTIDGRGIGIADYGQLIINAEKDTRGTTTMEKVLVLSSDDFADSWLPYTFPFKNHKYSVVASQLGITTANYEENDRWNNTFMVWNNTPITVSDIAFDHASNANISANSDFNPYLLNIINNWTPGRTIADLTQKRNYTGTPNNAAATLQTSNMDVAGKFDQNKYGERFNTFVDDRFEEIANWVNNSNPDGYGDHMYEFSNPYTSNIDLSGIGFAEGGDRDDGVDLQNIAGLVTYNASDYQYGGLGTYNQTQDLRVTFDANGEPATGDVNALIIKPFNTFVIKGQDAIGNMEFTENLKTFKFDPKLTLNNGTPLEGRTIDEGYYQLGMNVSINGEASTNRFYVVAAEAFDASAEGATESYANVNENGLFTFQENEAGVIDENLSSEQTYINGVNKSSYVAKPIFVGVKSEGENTFTLNADLRVNLVGVEGNSFDNGDQFFFEDRQTGFITPVTNDFEYTFTQNGDVNDRIVIYWNGTPDNLAVEDATELAAQTIIYKNQDNHEIRFDKSWNTADVYVYNAMGQLVFNQNNVNTNHVFVLPLSKDQSMAYIIKTVSDAGEVVTKKIVR